MPIDHGAFMDGAIGYARSSGIPWAESVVKTAAGFRRQCLSDPASFFHGARDAVKEAAKNDDYEIVRKRTGVQKALPWILSALGFAGALGAGSMWGRYAAAKGDGSGPIAGPIKELLSQATGRKIDRLGLPLIPRHDEYHSPISAREYDNLVRHESKSPNLELGRL